MIWAAALTGLASAAGSWLSGKSQKKAAEKQAKLQGQEERKTIQFQSQLEDFYKQQERQRNRQALNTYGRFSLMSDIMPTTSPDVKVPLKPTV